VKVLVDLAMISAQGQDDLEVQKVSCLHAAATGYAPLIYDMQSNMGFKEFLPLCQAVWRVLEVDAELPRKFVSCNLAYLWLLHGHTLQYTVRLFSYLELTFLVLIYLYTFGKIIMFDVNCENFLMCVLSG
jgi:hypothetical protein